MPAFVKRIGMAIGLLLVGVAVGRYATPTKVKVVETEKVVEKVVEKEVFVKVKEDTKSRSTTKTRTIIEKPDGTKITKETETDKQSTKNLTNETKKEEKEQVKEKVVTRFLERYRPNHTYHFEILGRYNFKQKMDYGPKLTVRFQGPMTAGVWGLYKTEGYSHEGKKYEIGFSLGVEF